MFNYDLLPEHIRGGVRRYVEEGIIPGDFLQAVIRNDLMESFSRADETNIARMFDIVSFFYNETPNACWGSEEKMLSWMKRAKEISQVTKMRSMLTETG